MLYFFRHNVIAASKKKKINMLYFLEAKKKDKYIVFFRHTHYCTRNRLECEQNFYALKKSKDLCDRLSHIIHFIGSGLKPNPQYFWDIKTENGPQVPSEEDYYIMQCSRAVKKKQRTLIQHRNLKIYCWRGERYRKLYRTFPFTL